MKAMTLFKWDAFIDAEGRCENYWLHGYTATEFGIWDAKRNVKKELEESGDKYLDLKVERIGYVTLDEAA